MKKSAVRKMYILKDRLSAVCVKILFVFFRLLPVKNKVIASAFKGEKYGDNPRYILEELHKISPETEMVWIKDKRYRYDTPEYIRPVTKNVIFRAYEYATAKVWIDTHRYHRSLKKKNGQLVIETWHGGLGIKKIDGDVEKFKKMKKMMNEVKHTSRLADVFISNSDHLSNIYRTAFFYDGPIYKCGYPKNDILFRDSRPMKEAVRGFYGLPADMKLMVYAPTFRDSFTIGKNANVSFDVYDIDYNMLHKALCNKFGGEWMILVKHHPFLMKFQKENIISGGYVINATDYPDMQELIMACDAFISDYSSCIFDAAMTRIPCFTYAKDFEEYKGDRGVYYKMEELPFPYARNNGELAQNIESFDYNDYISKWDAFKLRTGLHETGHAAKDIAKKIKQFIDGEDVKWTS